MGQSKGMSLRHWGLVAVLLLIQCDLIWTLSKPAPTRVWQQAYQQAQKDRDWLIQQADSTGRQLEDADALVELLHNKVQNGNP